MTQEHTDEKALATRQYADMSAWMKKRKNVVSQLAKTHFDSDRFMSVVLDAARRNPVLMQTEPASMLAVMMDCARLDIDRIGRGGMWLVPFFNKKKQQYEVQGILDYRAEIDLARRSGYIKQVSSHIVYSGDRFEYALGDDERIVHVPPVLGEERGEMIGVYAIAHLTNGGIHRVVLSMANVNSYRNRSKARGGPWETDFEAMAKKTALRRLCNLLPVDGKYRDHIAKEDEFENDPDVITIHPEVETEPPPDEEPKDDLVKKLEESITQKAEKKAAPKGKAS